jgi:hypothetical protein
MIGLLSAGAGGLGLIWFVFAPHSADLTREQAAKVIAVTPEFNRSRTIERVLTTTRGVKSMNNTYFVEFEFRDNSAAAPVRADASFYWNKSWRLQEFWYGNPPNVETVWIDGSR